MGSPVTSYGLAHHLLHLLPVRKLRYQTNTLLTIWWIELLPIFRTPPYRVDVRTIVLTPVVIRVIPLVEVNQEIVANHVRHRGNADQIWIFAIHSFQLHADFESV